MRYATCHPDRKHKEHGLCIQCASRRYYEIHKKRIIKRVINWQKTRTTKAYRANKARRYRRRHPEAYILAHVKHRAQNTGVEFAITADDIVIPNTCPILGIPLQCGASGRYGPTDNSPSLDRINPELGYIPGNVAVISQRANTIKCHGTAEEHEKIAAWMRRMEKGLG